MIVYRMDIKSKINKYLLLDFFSPAYLISIAVLAVVLFYSLFFEIRTLSERPASLYPAVSFNEGWRMISPAGDETEAVIPGELRSEGGMLRMDNVLPGDIKPGYYAAFRADRQATDIFIDGSLRRSCSEDGRYHVFVRLTPEDAGKTISVRFRNKSLPERVPVYEIYLGEETGIWQKIARGSLGMMAMAVVGLAASVLLLIASLYLSVRDHFMNELIFLSLTGIAFGFWEIMSNITFQFFFDSTAQPYYLSCSIACFMQIPFIVYVDLLKEHRYSYILDPLFAVDIIFGFLMIILNGTGILTFNDTGVLIAIMQMITGGTIAVVFRTDVKRGFVRSYQVILTGFFIFAVTNTLEFLRFLFFPLRGLAGISALGVAGLITFAVLNSLVEYSRIRSERDTALRLKTLRSSFLAAMSHEIRTPINSIISLNDAILQEEKDEKVLFNSRMIRDSSKELLLLVNDILDISRIEAGKFTPASSPFRISGCVAHAVSSCSDRAKVAGLRLVSDGPFEGEPVYMGDDKRIEVVLQNLITFFTAGRQREKASLAESLSEEISITVRHEEGGVFITVSCIPEGVRNMGVLGDRDIFTHTADAILKSLGSRLEEEKKESVTSAFGLSLSLSAAPAGVEPPREKQSADGFPDLTGVSILAVDDQDVNRFMLRKMLGKAGAEVSLASSGQEAVELTLLKHFDLVLMDVRMPGMSGTEAMRRIKTQSRVPVVAFTASNDLAEQEDLVKQGFDTFISKPVEPAVLFAIIKLLLEDRT